MFQISQDGIITTRADNVLDYETQTDVIIQIQASDGVHNTLTQFVINVEDVNDETPSIRVVSNTQIIYYNFVNSW